MSLEVFRASDTGWRSMAGDIAIPVDKGDGYYGIGFVGDSLTAQYSTTPVKPRDALLEMGWPDTQETRVDGLVSRVILGSRWNDTHKPWSETVIDNWISGGFTPRTWVLALGMNNQNDPTTWVPDTNALLDHIAASGRDDLTVHLVGITYGVQSSWSKADSFWDAISSIPASRSDMTINAINFHSLLHNGRDETGFWLNTTDGIHMTNAGYVVRNRIIAQAIGGP